MSANRRPPHLLTRLLEPAAPTPGASALRTELASDGGFAPSVRALAELVGGIGVLETLTAHPLPPEVIDSSGVDGVLRVRVEAIAAAIEGYAARFSFIDVPDAEYRTIVARLVGRILERAPGELLRSTPERVGAALVWLAMHGNNDLGRHARWTAACIWEGFDVGPATDLGRRLHRAAGVPVLDERWDLRTPVWLADVAFLHSRTRQALVMRRDAFVRVIAEAAEHQRANAPVQRAPDGRVAIQGHRTVPQLAARSSDANGRHVVAIAFGNDETDVEVLCVSVPDGHRLVQMLQHALDMAVDHGSSPTGPT